MRKFKFMSLHQLKKQSDLEKRLRLLRQQVYGKEKLDVRSEKLESSNLTSNIPPQGPTSHISSPTSDITYLYQDLFKIGILASLAIGVQVILFMLTKNHILNLNFF